MYQDRHPLFEQLIACWGSCVFAQLQGAEEPVQGCLGAMGDQGITLFTAAGVQDIPYDRLVQVTRRPDAAEDGEALCRLVGMVGQLLQFPWDGKTCVGLLQCLNLTTATLLTAQGPLTLPVAALAQAAVMEEEAAPVETAEEPQPAEVTSPEAQSEEAQPETQSGEAQPEPAEEQPAPQALSRKELIKLALTVEQTLRVSPNRFEQAVLDGDQQLAVELLNRGYLNRPDLGYTSGEVEAIATKLSKAGATINWGDRGTEHMAKRILYIQKNKNRLAHYYFEQAIQEAEQKHTPADSMVRSLYIVLQSEGNAERIQYYYENYPCLHVKADGGPNLHNEKIYQTALNALAQQDKRSVTKTAFRNAVNRALPKANPLERSVIEQNVREAQRLILSSQELETMGYQSEELEGLQQSLPACWEIKGATNLYAGRRLAQLQGNRNRQAERQYLLALGNQKDLESAGALLRLYLAEGEREAAKELLHQLPGLRQEPELAREAVCLLWQEEPELAVQIVEGSPLLLMDESVRQCLLAALQGEPDALLGKRAAFLQEQLAAYPDQQEEPASETEEAEAPKQSAKILWQAFLTQPQEGAPGLVELWQTRGDQSALLRFLTLWPEVAGLPACFRGKVRVYLEQQDEEVLELLRQAPLTVLEEDSQDHLPQLAEASGDQAALALLTLLRSKPVVNNGLVQCLLRCDAALVMYMRDVEQLTSLGYTEEQIQRMTAAYDGGRFTRGTNCRQIGQRLYEFLGDQDGLAEAFLRCCGDQGQIALYDMYRTLGRKDAARSLLQGQPAVQQRFREDHLRLLLEQGEAQAAYQAGLGQSLQGEALLLWVLALLRCVPEEMDETKLTGLEALEPAASLIQPMAEVLQKTYAQQPEEALGLAIRWVSALLEPVGAQALRPLVLLGGAAWAEGLSEEEEGLLLRQPKGYLLAMVRQQLTGDPYSEALTHQREQELLLLPRREGPAEEKLQELKLLCLADPTHVGQYLSVARTLLTETDPDLTEQTAVWALHVAPLEELPDLLGWLEERKLLWEEPVVTALLQRAEEPDWLLPVATSLTAAAGTESAALEQLLPLYWRLLTQNQMGAELTARAETLCRAVLRRPEGRQNVLLEQVFDRLLLTQGRQQDAKVFYSLLQYRQEQRPVAQRQALLEEGKARYEGETFTLVSLFCDSFQQEGLLAPLTFCQTWSGFVALSEQDIHYRNSLSVSGAAPKQELNVYALEFLTHILLAQPENQTAWEMLSMAPFCQTERGRVSLACCLVVIGGVERESAWEQCCQDCGQDLTLRLAVYVCWMQTCVQIYAHIGAEKSLLLWLEQRTEEERALLGQCSRPLMEAAAQTVARYYGKHEEWRFFCQLADYLGQEAWLIGRSGKELMLGEPTLADRMMARLLAKQQPETAALLAQGGEEHRRHLPLLRQWLSEPKLLEEPAVQQALALLTEDPDGNDPGIETLSTYTAAALHGTEEDRRRAETVLEWVASCQGGEDAALHFLSHLLRCALPETTPDQLYEGLWGYLEQPGKIERQGWQRAYMLKQHKLLQLLYRVLIRGSAPEAASQIKRPDQLRTQEAFESDLRKWELRDEWLGQDWQAEAVVWAARGSTAALQLESYRQDRPEVLNFLAKLSFEDAKRSTVAALLTLPVEERPGFYQWVLAQKAYSSEGPILDTFLSPLLDCKGEQLQQLLQWDCFAPYVQNALPQAYLPQPMEPEELAYAVYVLEWLRPKLADPLLGTSYRPPYCRGRVFPELIRQLEGEALERFCAKLVSLPYPKHKWEGSFRQWLSELLRQLFQAECDHDAANLYLALRSSGLNQKAAEPWPPEGKEYEESAEKAAGRLACLFDNRRESIQSDLGSVYPKACVNLVVQLLSSNRAEEYYRLRRLMSADRAALCDLARSILLVPGPREGGAQRWNAHEHLPLCKEVLEQEGLSPWRRVLDQVADFRPSKDESFNTLSRAVLYHLARFYWSAKPLRPQGNSLGTKASGEAFRRFTREEGAAQVRSWERSALLIRAPHNPKAYLPPIPLEKLPPLPQVETLQKEDKDSISAQLYADIQGTALWKAYAQWEGTDQDKSIKQLAEAFTRETDRQKRCQMACRIVELRSQAAVGGVAATLGWFARAAMNLMQYRQEQTGAGGGEVGILKRLLSPLYDVVRVVPEGMIDTLTLRVDDHFYRGLTSAMGQSVSFDELAEVLHRDQERLQRLIRLVMPTSEDDRTRCDILKKTMEYALQIDTIRQDAGTTKGEKCSLLLTYIHNHFPSAFSGRIAKQMTMVQNLQRWVNDLYGELSDAPVLTITVLNQAVTKKDRLYGVVANIGSRPACALSLQAFCCGIPCGQKELALLPAENNFAPFALPFDLTRVEDVAAEVPYTISVSYNSPDGTPCPMVTETGTLPLVEQQPCRLPKNNAYHMESIKRREDIIGRHDELRRLDANFGPESDPEGFANVEMYGLKRTGKSSLLHVTEEILQQRKDVLKVYVDCENINEQVPYPLWEVFVHRPLIEARKYVELTPEYQELYGSYIEADELNHPCPVGQTDLDLNRYPFLLKDFYERMHTVTGLHLVLLLDEADVLLNTLEKRNASTQQLYKSLRALMDHTAEFTLVLCGSDLLQTFTFERTALSQMLDAFGEKMQVGRLSYDDQCELLCSVAEGTDLVYTEDAKALAWQFTAGQAWYTKLMGNRILTQLHLEKRATVYPSDVLTAITEGLIPENTIYEKLLENLLPDERMVARALQKCLPNLTALVPQSILVQSMSGELAPAKVERALDTLCRRDIVELRMVGNVPHYHFATGLYHCWFRRYAQLQGSTLESPVLEFKENLADLSDLEDLED